MVKLCVIRKGNAMFDLNELDENTYELIKDAAKRNNVGVYEFISTLVSNAAGEEYAQQQIDDNRSNG